MTHLSLTIQRSVKGSIERMTCPVHGEHPKLSFTSSGFTVSCCCDNFRSKVIAECKDAIAKAVEADISKALKGIR